MKIIGKILSVLAIICYILIAGVLFVAAPMVKGYKPVVVLTGSMAPTYPVGTVIYYEPVPEGDKAALEKYIEENIQKGDVISFGKSDDKKSMVTHRVEAVLADRDKISTKGDANDNADPKPIDYSNVIGKVIKYHLPYAGYVVKYLQNYYIIGVVFALLLAKLVYNRLAGREDERKKAAAGTAQELPPPETQLPPAQAPDWTQPPGAAPPDFNRPQPAVQPQQPWAPPQPWATPPQTATPANPAPPQPSQTAIPAQTATPGSTVPPVPPPQPNDRPAFSADVQPLPWAQDPPREMTWDPNEATQNLTPEANQTDVKQ